MNNNDLGFVIGILIILGTAILAFLRFRKEGKLTFKKAAAYSIMFLFGLAVIYPNSSRLREMIETLANFR